MELLFLSVKLTGKLGDGTIFTKKGDDERTFEFKIDEGMLILVMFFDHGRICIIMVLLSYNADMEQNKSLKDSIWL